MLKLVTIIHLMKSYHWVGKKLVIGTPLVEGAKVVAKVIKQGRSPKIIVFKMKKRKKLSS